MKKYKIEVILEETYDDIEAESEEEAFVIASDFAMQGGCWSYKILKVEDLEELLEKPKEEEPNGN